MVDKARRGDEAAFEMIVKHYEREIKVYSSKYFILGAERDDVEQVARIGLWKATLTYEDAKGTFDHFAMKVCVKRAILTEMSVAKRRRMIPLNEGISLETPVMSSDGNVCQEMGDSIPDLELQFEKRLMDEYEYDLLERELLSNLTELESDSYVLYKDGFSYREISVALNQTEKTVDNALMRVRNKAKQVLERHLSTAMVTGEDLEATQAFAKLWDCEKVLSLIMESQEDLVA